MRAETINLGEPMLDIAKGGWGRSFEATYQGGAILTGRVVFGFKGGRDSRTFAVEAIFDHDPLCRSFTDPLESSEKVVDLIRDDEAASVLIQTALD